MRRLGVCVWLGVAACADHYGAYIRVTGERTNAADTTFDRLEMFFVSPDAMSCDTTGALAPQLISPAGPWVPQPGSTCVWTRAARGDTDTFGPSATPLTSHEIRVPYVADGAQVGPYLLVVAQRDGLPVGYAEIDGLDVTAEYTRYTLPLQPSPLPVPSSGKLPDWPDGAETWGPPGDDSTCARMTANHMTTFVVTDGDADCDGFADATEDCAPQLYCDPMSTVTAPADLRPCEGTCTFFAPPSGIGCSLGLCTNSPAPRASCDPLPVFPWGGSQPEPLCVTCPAPLQACDHKDLGNYLGCVDPPAEFTCDVPLFNDGTLCGNDVAVIATVPIADLTSSNDCSAAALLLPSSDASFTYTLHPPTTNVSGCQVTVQISNVDPTNPAKFFFERAVINFPQLPNAGFDTFQLDLKPSLAMPCNTLPITCVPTASPPNPWAVCSG